MKPTKDRKLIVKAFENLGYNPPTDIKTKSDLMLDMSNMKKHIQDSRDAIDNHNALIEQANRLLDIYIEAENEYEKEILRELNPNRTII